MEGSLARSLHRACVLLLLYISLSDQVGTLVLTRHGQSEWNKLNLFTGWKDPALTELGKQEAKKGGEELVKGGYVSLACARRQVSQPS